MFDLLAFSRTEQERKIKTEGTLGQLGSIIRGYLLRVGVSVSGRRGGEQEITDQTNYPHDLRLAAAATEKRKRKLRIQIIS